MSQRTECFIKCMRCDVVVGKVIAKNTPERQDIWQNVSDPKVMPTKCKLCSSILQRVNP